VGAKACNTDIKNSSDSSKKQATIGEPITLRGPNDQKLTVTPRQVVNLSGYSDKGKYLVGVQVSLHNASSKPFSAIAVNTNAKMITDLVAQADAEFVDKPGCTAFGTDTVIAPDSDRSGCVAFQLINGQKPKTFRWVMNPYPGDTGEWSVR
jgi:hypothetical protein